MSGSTAIKELLKCLRADEGRYSISQEHNKLVEGSLLPEEYERELEKLTDCCGTSAGACGEMTTGKSGRPGRRIAGTVERLG